MKFPKLKINKKNKMRLPIPRVVWEKKSNSFSSGIVAPTIIDNVLNLFEQYQQRNSFSVYVYNKIWITENNEMLIINTKYGHLHGFGNQLYFFVKNPDGIYERKIKTNPAVKYYLAENIYEVIYSDYLIDCKEIIIESINLEI